MAGSRRDIPNKATVGIFRRWRCTLASAQHNPVASAWPISNKYDVTLVLGVGKFDRIRHLLSDRLHWLPVHKRVQFKLCLLAYKAVHSLAPQYLADFCRPVSSVDARQRFRSAARDDLVIDRTCTKFGGRSFAVAAPMEWNRLPHHIRALQSIDSFKVALKTHLFDCL